MWLTVLNQTCNQVKESLKVRGLSVHYYGQEKWVLSDVDLSYLEGQVCAVIGPSGCGKTTLIRTICGLIPHCLPSEYSGCVELCGTQIADASVEFIARQVAYVGQNPDAAVITRSVHDDIAFALQNLCLDPDTIESRVVQAAAQVGLGEKLHDNPWTLSGGQRQRLAIAVVLAMRPKLLVLDEPTSTIDSLGSRDFYDLIEQLVHQDLGVIVIDHDLDPLLPICDSVLALNEKGEIIAAGTPREVFLNHTQELARCGIWLPRAIRSGCKEALTCSEAGIELPQLNEFCDSQVKYWMRDDSGWHETGESVSARPEALLKLNDFSVPRRCPSISAEFAAGDFVAVIGQNGAGKSSMLSALAGLLRFEGNASVTGIPLKKGNHQVGYVFQNPEHQMVAATVRKELSVGKVTDSQINDLLNRFHLQAVSEQHPLTLSGGQQRRLSVATMVAEQRKVIVLDEPTYGQDWANTCELMEFIQQLCSTGHLVIMATHDLELAKKYCSHIIALPFSPQVTAPAALPQHETRGLFDSFNPLTLFIALVPLMVMIFVLKNPVVNFSLLSVSSLAMLLAGANRTRALGSILGSWLVAAFMIWMFSDNDVLSMASRLNDVGTSYAAGSGIGALIALVLLSGIYSDPTKMLVSLNQTFKVPYRITSAGIAAVSFITRFQNDFKVLRTAKALRGVGQRYGIFAPVARWAGSLVPLAILAVQHGERVALSMDSRGFGAFPKRTELIFAPWRVRDWALVVTIWIVTTILCLFF